MRRHDFQPADDGETVRCAECDLLQSLAHERVPCPGKPPLAPTPHIPALCCRCYCAECDPPCPVLVTRRRGSPQQQPCDHHVVGVRAHSDVEVPF